jgi:DNA-binding response OmpR family regulator
LEQIQLLENLKKIKVLYVEDDPYQREQTLAILELFFDKIDTAIDAPKALTLLKKTPYELLLCDIMLPTFSGTELAKQLRQFNEKIHIIFFSSSIQSDDFRDAIHLNAIDYLVKPFSFSELKESLLKFAKKVFEQETKPVFITNNIYYDTLRHCAIIDNKEIALTKKEQLFFSLIIQKKSQVITYELIWNALYEDLSEVNINTIKNIIFRLRKKLGVELFINIAEVGYRII